ncbi:hypothetical protein ACFVT5_20780 [Streptomyces sp. NPDC058001]|uniref:hypothetical protein n=1 Tax=Streptomyces sp. NPDC058001 TaxID=3346300 RepID=UPI0036DFB773
MERSFEVTGVVAACLSVAALTLAVLTTGGIRIGAPYALSLLAFVLLVVLFAISEVWHQRTRTDREAIQTAFRRLPEPTRWTVRALIAICVLVAVGSFLGGGKLQSTTTVGDHYYVYDLKPTNGPKVEVSYADYETVLMREERLMLATGGAFYAGIAYRSLATGELRRTQPWRRRSR